MEALIGRALVGRGRCLTAWWICPRPMRGSRLTAGLVRPVVIDLDQSRRLPVRGAGGSLRLQRSFAGAESLTRI